MRKSSLGRFSIARTTLLIDGQATSQRSIDSRRSERETRKTTRAPESAAKYEMIAPVQGPKVYPDKTMRVEYRGMGAIGFLAEGQYVKGDGLRMVVRKIRKKRTA
jgi:hypothetical protein